jgi:hypothetical protein
MESALIPASPPKMLLYRAFPVSDVNWTVSAVMEIADRAVDGVPPTTLLDTHVLSSATNFAASDVPPLRLWPE